jgi:hypothetical protein
MELKLAIEYANFPDKIADAEACNFAAALISGYITMQEEEEFALRLECDKKEDTLYAEFPINALVARKIRLTEEYRIWQESKRELARYKRLRNTLADRFTVLTRTKHY